MIEPRQPIFDWGQRVVALVDMLNDGSYPDRGEAECLVSVGTEGEVVQVGQHTDSHEPVYMVDFGGLVVGCMEDEIMLVQELRDMAQKARASTASASTLA